MTEHALAPARRVRTSSATLAFALGASALATAGAATAAGGTTAIDLMLRQIARDHGAELASRVADGRHSA